MRNFAAQLRGELRKLFGRKRTYIGFGAFLAVEILIVTLLTLPKPKAAIRRLIEGGGYLADEYFGGLTLAVMILTWTTVLIGALYLALVSGDIVSKDVEDGAMRMILCRPISRARIIVLKYAACVIYTVALTLFIGVTALLTGFLWGGVGGLFVYDPMQGVFALYPAAEGLGRFALALGALAGVQLSVSSLGFVLSCCNIKPAAATVVTLSYFFLDSIFQRLPYFESLQPWFITTHMSAWIHLFDGRIPWTRIGQDFTYLLALDVTFFLVGLAIFERRDFKG